MIKFLNLIRRNLDFISLLQKICQDEDSEICIENRMLSY
jgi:hypothetical protein